MHSQRALIKALTFALVSALIQADIEPRGLINFLCSPEADGSLHSRLNLLIAQAELLLRSLRYKDSSPAADR